jgi:hypothetical protein
MDLSVESEYDTDNVISDILGLETLSDTTYVPVCSDISDADDELLILTAEKMKKGSDYSTQARNNLSITLHLRSMHGCKRLGHYFIPELLH